MARTKSSVITRVWMAANVGRDMADKKFSATAEFPKRTTRHLRRNENKLMSLGSMSLPSGMSFDSRLFMLARSIEASVEICLLTRKSASPVKDKFEVT